MKIVVIFSLIVALSLPSFAQTVIKSGEAAPFDGMLLTNSEAAKVLAEAGVQKALCKENIRYEKEKITSASSLEKRKLEIIIATQDIKYKDVMELKELEIKRLYKQLEDMPNNNTSYWFSGGLALGSIVAIVASVAIFFAATQINRTTLVPL